MMNREDNLHNLGMFIIGMDYRIVALSSMVIFLILYIARFAVRLKPCGAKKASEISAMNLISALLSILSLYGAAKIAAVFLLTKPPAFIQLEEGEIAIIGIISSIILIGLGVLGVAGFYNREQTQGDVDVKRTAANPD